MKRKLILCPDINHASFVLLFEKGDSGDSWSIRDYSRPNEVSVRYAPEFRLSLAELKSRAINIVDAPTKPVSDLHFWHSLTLETNSTFSMAMTEISAPSSILQTNSQVVNTEIGPYILLDLSRLMSLPKARKQQDMRRILHSANSEDWVTWNVFALAERVAPQDWWSHLVQLAQAGNPDLSLPENWEENPQISLWRCVCTPPLYEAASRKRMRESDDLIRVSRSEAAGPVEGESEIDITLRSSTLTVFIEAKLGSDISMRTSHDPSRNQIVRNIDCLIEESKGTKPIFWMMAPDSDPKKAYTQLMSTYRAQPEKLAAALPHRDPKILAEIASSLSIIHWNDFLDALNISTVGSIETERVHHELKRRVS